jgi:hypothetical protein
MGTNTFNSEYGLIRESVVIFATLSFLLYYWSACSAYKVEYLLSKPDFLNIFWLLLFEYYETLSSLISIVLYIYLG